MDLARKMSRKDELNAFLNTEWLCEQCRRKSKETERVGHRDEKQRGEGPEGEDGLEQSWLWTARCSWGNPLAG